jgi:hypothetical protein
MGIQHMAAKAQIIGITAKYPPLPNPDSLTDDQLAEDYEKSGNKKRYIPYEGIGIEDDINNPEGLPDTSDPNDFPEEPELVTSGCFRRYGDYSYSHIHHKEGDNMTGQEWLSSLKDNEQSGYRPIMFSIGLYIHQIFKASEYSIYCDS